MDTSDNQHIINQVKSYLEQKFAKNEIGLLKHLADIFFGPVAIEELICRDIPSLANMVSAYYDFIKVRPNNEIKFSLFNPDENNINAPTVVMLSQNDMSFIVDSLLLSLYKQGIHVNFITHSGAVEVTRNDRGEMLAISHKKTDHSMSEACIYLEVDQQPGEFLPQIKESLHKVLINVSLVVQDFLPMKHALSEVIKTLAGLGTLDDQSIEFLKWLERDHFTFLGYDELMFDGKTFVSNHKNLGLLSDNSGFGKSFFNNEFANAHLPEDPILLITKSAYFSPVHRDNLMDVILVKKFDEKGQCIGQHRFYGLYTSTAYHCNPRKVPLIKDKIQMVLTRTKVPEKSHDGKALIDIIESLPRDELYQMESDELYDITRGILHIQDRPLLKLFLRKERFNRYVHAMVYLPRELIHNDLSIKLQNILMHELSGRSASSRSIILSSLLGRIDFLIEINADTPPAVSVPPIEKKMLLAARTWREQLSEVLIKKHGIHRGSLLYNKYARAFPPGYAESFTPLSASHDITEMELLQKSERLGIRLYHKNKILHLKILQKNASISLSDTLPILENMGLKVLSEHPFQIRLTNKTVIWISDFVLDSTHLFEHFAKIKAPFKKAFHLIFTNRVENDGFNRLITTAGLASEHILLLRAIAKYLTQINFTYSQSYIQDTLNAYPHMSDLLIRLFINRFTLVPSEERALMEITIVKELNKLLGKVNNLDHDRIFRRFMEFILATVRTNYFQHGEHSLREYISFKLMPHKITDMPKPVPLFEIFVYSPRVEGVHLRGAKVARGGIRWSDRREDFRTEILGLMKAQQVKNAVIVPLGAKGGFYPKQLPSEREAKIKEAIACYQIFMRGLLDITDNIVEGKVVPPKNVVRYDEDDPYLVVAADKGTATFSDIANGIAAEYGFWLGDAFASGGSQGYDHKKMGITARGAWESVKRHFYFLGKDIQREDFSVIAIGDMSGDVFGNGMLLSEHIKLIGAFNHEHIFLDPNPNPKVSFNERQRLFNLPRSSWMDYDKSLISAGGGVFSRAEKVIPLSPEIKIALDIELDALDPNQLIRALLKAPVELLFNGGIGTYVKAHQENNVEIGDRANDAVRINANELRCKVVGEGGNLGFSQLARIEFAQRGGQICTDAIDNSAGVDCSDHEVNIKILLNDALNRGELTLAERNELLGTMRDDVAQLVLSNNYHQTQAISQGIFQLTALPTYIRLLRELEREQFIDRVLEALPSDKILRARLSSGRGLTKPEFSVLMAYVKTTIKKLVLTTSLPEEPYFERYLALEFPEVLSKRFPRSMKNHPLKREIIATQMVNQMVQYLNIAYVHRMYDEVGASPSQSLRAFAAVIEIFDVGVLWREIEALDGQVNARLQIDMSNDFNRFLQHECRFLLRHFRKKLNVENLITQFKTPVLHLTAAIPSLLNREEKNKLSTLAERYTKEGAPKPLALKIATLNFIMPVLDIIFAANTEQLDIILLAEAYYELNRLYQFDWLRNELLKPRNNYWEMLTSAALLDELNTLQAKLCVCILKARGNKKVSLAHFIPEWSKAYTYSFNRFRVLLEDLKISPEELVRYEMNVQALHDIVALLTEE